jgi:ABC-type lipoprotein export system ATPase subunit
VWQLAGHVNDVMEAPALRCRGLRLRLGGRDVLDGADLEVAAGETVAVMGPSGSGKTTLLHCIAGLLRPGGGEITIGGTPVHRLRRRARARLRLESVGMVFQFGELLDELTVTENVELPIRLRRESTGGVASLLESVGLTDHRAAWPTDLSGGEVQRVAIARAVAGRPAVLLADEPTGALDEDLSRAVSDLLVERARAVGAALVVATHDPFVAASMDRTVRLRRGRLVPA